MHRRLQGMEDEMSLFQVDFYSNALARSTGFTAVIPNDVSPMMTEGNECYQRKTKVLFLLHGYSGSSKDWLTGTRVSYFAGKYNLAIVMPTGENSFYLDRKGTGRAYGRFVGQELVDYVRNTFGLSSDKEDTYIGGLSMGGFGAIHTGLAYPNTFGKIMGLSSALIIHNVEKMQEGFQDAIADYDYYTSVFGDPNQLGQSMNNPEVLIRKLKEDKQPIPSLYMACGTEDFLIEENRAFHQFLLKENVPVTYIESPGAHNWDFWNEYLEPSIQWMLGLK
jgi:S-formylglutathione hydrolase FrmB